MDNDLISRSSLMCEIDWLNRSYPEDCKNEVAEKLVKLIEQASAVDAESVRHGRWIQKRMNVPKGKGQTYLVWGCSLCKAHEKKRSAFCPNCGATMDAEVSE